MTTYYSEQDYFRVNKIDGHCHVLELHPAFEDVLKRNHFSLFSINTNVPYAPYPSPEKQQEIILQYMARESSLFNYATTFCIKKIAEEAWAGDVMEHILNAVEKGASAVKVWKNIGMDEKDDEGNFIFLDDARLDAIFQFLESEGIPVLGHIGEPKNCWLPLEEMTVENDRAYYNKHPEYHMYKHPEYPSYQRLLDSVGHVLTMHPKLKYIGCHLGSQEWSVEEVAHRLDKYPGYAVDLADRIIHLKHQSISRHDKVRAFIIKYQDRLIYGTDFELAGPVEDQEFFIGLEEVWKSDWKYFTGNESMFDDELEAEIRGLKLPSRVVNKLFFENASNWLLKQKK